MQTIVQGTFEELPKVAGLDKVRPEAYSEGAELNKSGFPFRYFRLRTVCEITGLSKTTVYEYSRKLFKSPL